MDIRLEAGIAPLHPGKSPSILTKETPAAVKRGATRHKAGEVSRRGLVFENHGLHRPPALISQMTLNLAREFPIRD